MKITLKQSLFFLSIAVFSLVACGDDDDGTTPTDNNNGGNGGGDTTQVTDFMKATISGSVINYEITVKAINANDNLALRGVYKPDSTGSNDEILNFQIPETTSEGSVNLGQSQISFNYSKDGETYLKKSGTMNITKFNKGSTIKLNKRRN